MAVAQTDWAESTWAFAFGVYPYKPHPSGKRLRNNKAEAKKTLDLRSDCLVIGSTDSRDQRLLNWKLLRAFL
jgi:hypothetical protein